MRLRRGIKAWGSRRRVRKVSGSRGVRYSNRSYSIKVGMKAIVVLLAIAGVCMAAIQRKEASTDSNNPGKCIENGRAYSPDEHWDIRGKCARGTCYESSGSLYVSIATCGVIAARPGCRLTDIDYSREYPSCCPDVECT